jgi:cell division ATPase FtsA
MADIKDVSQVLQSALAEIGVSGDLAVEMDGEQIERPLGHAGDALAVKVVIEDKLDERAPMHLWDNRAV